MKDRKLMIEVTNEEYELLKKGIKLSDMKTEDLIYELMSRSDEKVILSRGVLVGTPDMKGCIHIADGDFDFKFTSRGPRTVVSAMLDPLDPVARGGMTNETLNKMFKEMQDMGYSSRRK